MSTITDDYYNSTRQALPFFIRIVKLNDNELYSLGKDMPYKQRVLLDCEIDCIKKNQPFSTTTAMYDHEEEFIDKLINHDELDYIINHISEIFRGKNFVNEKILEYLKSWEEFILGDIKHHIEIIITKCLSSYYINQNDEELNKLHQLLVSVAEEEHTSLFSLKKINYGAFSTIYRINNKVIKIGYRAIETIPNCSRLLLPEFKGKIGSDYIEITDYVETNENDNMEDAYLIYKELRDQGLIWLDPRSDNLAILDKKACESQNKKRNEILSLDIGYNPNFHKRELEEGDLVIIDLDHIVFEDDQDSINRIKRDLNEIIVDRIALFEKRYQDEKEEQSKKEQKRLYKS